MKPWEFDRLEPREFHALVRGYEWRRDRQHQEDIRLAWVMAALSRQRKLPPLERLLQPAGTRRVLDPESARRDYEELKQRLG